MLLLNQGLVLCKKITPLLVGKLCNVVVVKVGLNIWLVIKSIIAHSVQWFRNLVNLTVEAFSLGWEAPPAALLVMATESFIMLRSGRDLLCFNSLSPYHTPQCWFSHVNSENDHHFTRKKNGVQKGWVNYPCVRSL